MEKTVKNRKIDKNNVIKKNKDTSQWYVDRDPSNIMLGEQKKKVRENLFGGWVQNCRQSSLYEARID